MKKVIPFLLLIAAAFPTLAQVTLHTTQLPDNYFYNYWYNIDPHQHSIETVSSMVQMGQKHNGRGFAFHSKDTPLQIFGVAASLATYELKPYEHYVYDSVNGWQLTWDSTMMRFLISKTCDTGAYDEAYEYFGVYERVYDSLHSYDSLRLIGPQAMVNIKTTPATYYLDFGTRSIHYPDKPTPLLPVYEMYFDTTVEVYDSFYIAMTCYNYSREDKCPGKWFYTWPIFWNYIGIEPDSASNIENFAHHYASPDMWSFVNDIDYIWFVFPILATTHRNDYIDTSTLGIADRGLERFVAVTPNPAGKQVRVVSSIGISHLDAYNTKGVKVMEQPISGNDITLDITSWPEGCYVLHLRTPFGVATKRLIVTRQ